MVTDFYYSVLADAAAECGLDIKQRHLKYMAKAVANAVARLDQDVREALQP